MFVLGVCCCYCCVFLVVRALQIALTHQLTKRKCDPLIRKLHKSCGKTLPYRTSKEQMQYVEQLSSIFEASFAQLFADFHEYTIRDLTDPDNPITVFMKESFLADLAATDVEFTRPFLESQLFFEYSDKKLRKRDDKHSKVRSQT